MKKILDPASSSRMFYFDKQDSRVLFGDIRELETTLSDGRNLVIKPDVITDFTNLQFENETFKMVVFDPPHMTSLGENSWMAKKYGRLTGDWQTTLKSGFAECFRVLENDGFLVFKWNETDVPTKEILALTNQKPVFGHISGKRSQTHWILFMKERETT